MFKYHASGRWAAVALILSTSVSGQTMQLKEYDTISAPRIGQDGWFQRFMQSPSDAIKIADPVKLQDYVVDGKLTLSLNNYLELVLANNTAISLQKVLVQPQRNAIQRAMGIFDPIGTARYQLQRSSTPITARFDGSGQTTLSQQTQPLNFGYQQLFASGMTLNGNFSGNRNSTNSANAAFNPILSSNTGFTATQPLLRGRGSEIVRIPIYLAQSRLKAAEFRLEDTIMRQLVTAENVYWDVIQARETLRVQQQALALGKESLDRARKELELGAISELEIFQPEATYERARIFVTQAEFRLQQVEDSLRLQMAVDLDPTVRTLPIVLTESVLPPTESTKFDRETLIASAVAARPDLKAIRQELNVEDPLSLKLAGNAMRPDLSLTGAYTTQGTNQPNVFGGPAGNIGNSLGQMFGFNYPIYGMILQLRLPLRDRAAAANFSDSLVAKRADLIQERQALQTIRLEVAQAISQVENSRASVEIAKIAADLAQKRVDAEKKRYDLGVTQLFFVLQAQQDLTQAQSELVTNSVQYRRNLLNLLLRTGTLLTERSVVIR